MTTKTNRRGRPPKGSDTAKSKSVLIRLDEDEKQAFTEAAELAGLSLSGWIRERLRLAATKELRFEGRTVAFLKNDGAD
jgi:hypothetical protein